MPAASIGRQTQRTIGEITEVKQAAYLRRQDFDAAGINSNLREQQDNLQDTLIFRARFFIGDICVPGDLGPELFPIYSGGDLED